MTEPLPPHRPLPAPDALHCSQAAGAALGVATLQTMEYGNRPVQRSLRVMARSPQWHINRPRASPWNGHWLRSRTRAKDVRLGRVTDAVGGAALYRTGVPSVCDHYLIPRHRCLLSQGLGQRLSGWLSIRPRNAPRPGIYCNLQLQRSTLEKQFSESSMTGEQYESNISRGMGGA